MAGFNRKPYNPEDNKPKNNTTFEKKKTDFERVPYQFNRFRMAVGEEDRPVTFVDSPELFTDDQNALLLSVGMGQGPFDVWEHKVKIGTRWDNFFPSYYRQELDALDRFLMLKTTGTWYLIGEYLQTSKTPAEIRAFFNTKTLSKEQIDEILNVLEENDKQDRVPKVREVLEFSLGETVKYRIPSPEGPVDVEDIVRTTFDSKASCVTFRTVVDHGSYTSAKTGVTYKDQAKLFGSKGSTTGAWDKEYDKVEGRKSKTTIGLGLKTYYLDRSDDQKSPRVGSGRDYDSDMPIAKLQGINPDVVFELTEDSIRERLVEDGFFQYVRMLLNADPDYNNIPVGGSVDEMVALFKDNFLTEKAEVLIPRPADYQLISCRQTPSFLRYKLNIDEVGVAIADIDEDEIPF